MPGSQLQFELPRPSTMKARFEQAVGMAFGERDRLRQEIGELHAEKARLSAEVERLKEENDALRGSAEIWIRMYESQLKRGKAMEDRLSAATFQLPAPSA